MLRDRYAEMEHFGERPVLNALWSMGTSLRRFLDENGTPQTITRNLAVEPPLFSRAPISRILAITDKELDRCARLCGAETVPHTWGYAKTGYGYSGLELVAEIDFIDGETLPVSSNESRGDIPPEIQQQVDNGLSWYNHPLQRLRRNHLYDMRPHQFMYGLDVCDPDQIEPKLFLVDIEPVFRPKTDGY